MSSSAKIDYTSYRLNTSEVIQNHLPDLIDLANLAGVHVPPDILRILIELLEMDLHPYALKSLLREIYKSKGPAAGRKPVNV